MEILVTNDDGVDAPGILALEFLARDLGNVWVVAPSSGMSGCSHQVTTDSHLEFKEIRPRIYSVNGTPADCVRLGLHNLGKKFDWVFAGINAGGNLGVDIHLSGTVAAAREAAIHGVQGAAFSQYRKRGVEFDWERAVRMAKKALSKFFHLPSQSGYFWNVNFPHLDKTAADPGQVDCSPNPGPLPLDYKIEEGKYLYQGDYHNRHRLPESDVDVCFRGNVAITRLGVF